MLVACQTGFISMLKYVQNALGAICFALGQIQCKYGSRRILGHSRRYARAITQVAYLQTLTKPRPALL